MTITDCKTNHIIGLHYFKDETLQQIYKDSGELAKSNEFQVHYWALNLIKEYEDGSKETICLPLVIYNYTQSVSSASIDFDLKDVEEISEKLKPLAQAKANELWEKIKTKFSDYTPVLTPLNSLHRHP